MDPLEKERLRRQMALRMQAFLEGGKSVVCVSGHYNDPPATCDLCRENHAMELLVIRNKAGKKSHVAASCLKEMLRFQVTDVEDLPRWLEKIKELKVEFDKRKQDELKAREEERRRLEKKVILRKKGPKQPEL